MSRNLDRMRQPPSNFDLSREPTSKTELFQTALGRYNKYTEADRRAVMDAVDSGALFYPYGSYVSRLSGRLADEYRAAGCVLVSSGTAAVHVALASVGVDFGDEVVTTPLTDTGTILPIFSQGAVPVFADVDPATMMITAETIERVLSSRTRAIVVVHYGGFPADMDPIMELANSAGVAVIEDCAQAQGARYQGRPVGTIGDIGCFSTNDTKHVSCGDGGFVLAKSESVAHRARLFHDKGFDRSTGLRDPIFAASNYRMTELQAAVLESQWQHVQPRVQARRAFSQSLIRQMTAFGNLQPFIERPGDTSALFSFLVRVDSTSGGRTRDEICDWLGAGGVPARKGNLFDVMYRLRIFNEAMPRYMHHLAHPDYAEGDCPAAELAQASVIRIEMCETYGIPEIEVIMSRLADLFDGGLEAIRT
jgi:perosamine synthetase